MRTFYGNTAIYLDVLAKQISGADLGYSKAISKGLIGDKMEAEIPAYAFMVKSLVPCWLAQMPSVTILKQRLLAAECHSD